MRKALMMESLFLRRPVLNGFDIIAWAQAQGIASTLGFDDLHVTVAFSRSEVDLNKISDREDILIIPEGGTRSFETLGDKGAAVLRFESDLLEARWREIIDAGASWDHDGFKPHVTVTWDIGTTYPEDVEPYTGRIVLGRERLDPIDEDWSDKISEIDVSGQEFEIRSDVVKVDEGLGLVMGFAIVCTEKGQPYYDLQKQHIPETVMLGAALDFMENSQVAKEMHAGDRIGSVVFCWPMTADIAKALDIETKRTGLLIAMRPSDPAVLQKFRSGALTGFSIGGTCRITASEAAHA